MAEALEILNKIAEVIGNLFFNEMTATIVSGVLVFALSQLFIEYYLNPIKEYKKLKAKIAYTLTYYACYYSNPIKLEQDEKGLWQNGSNELRKVASEVDAFAQVRPKSNHAIPKKEDLLKVKSSIIGLSNSFFQTGATDRIDFNLERISEIETLLELK